MNLQQRLQRISDFLQVDTQEQLIIIKRGGNQIISGRDQIKRYEESIDGQVEILHESVCENITVRRVRYTC
ncbi:hypothetical protein NST63_27725 [Heyndrickxia sp. FSL W8-0496]|uniref:hypothetical protein n=1 Tax=Heyndrickxia sp. FSL W8-0496 TaxID=2954702 RepID=UPI0030F5CEFA